MMNKPDWEGFGMEVVTYGWPTNDIDGSELFALALMHNLIKPIEGGYNSEEHFDTEGICPEEGDPWYEYNFKTKNSN